MTCTNAIECIIHLDHQEISITGNDTSCCNTRCGFPSANLMTTWSGPMRTWMLGDSIYKHDLRKKLLASPEYRSARRCRRTRATCKLTIIKRESPLVVVTCNTGGLEGKATTGEPGLLFQRVGRPAPTGPSRFWTCDRGSTLVISDHFVYRYRR